MEYTVGTLTAVVHAPRTLVGERPIVFDYRTDDNRAQTLARRGFIVVLVSDAAINELHIELDDRCFKLLALHQPMAVDLRAIVSAVKINTDLERVGDLAVNIAEAVRRYLQHPPVKELIDIPRMAVIAQAMLRDALDAFVRRDTIPLKGQGVIGLGRVPEPQSYHTVEFICEDGPDLTRP